MIDVSRDFRIVPYSPVRLSDPFEIRFQHKCAGEIGLSVYLDEDGAPGALLCGEVCRPSESGFAYLNKYWLRASEIMTEGAHTLYLHAGDETARFPFVAESSRPVILDGGFIMFGPPNDRTACDPWRSELKQLSDEDWARYIRDMHDIGQTCIIINAAVQLLNIANKEYGAHYPSKLIKKSDIHAHDPIKAVLSAADELGMQVFIGIGNNYGGRAALEDWESDAQILEEVYRMYGGHRSFYGWYIARECNLIDPFPSYLEGAPLVCEKAKALSPALPLLISPYLVNEGENYEASLQRMWNIGFDIFMPQDMMGQRPNSSIRMMSRTRRFHEAARKACDATKKHLWGNNEAFNFTPDGKYLVPRYIGGGMWGEEGFISQIRAVEPYVEKRMNFMDAAFFTPPQTNHLPGGELAVKQYEEYKSYYESEAAK